MGEASGTSLRGTLEIYPFGSIDRTELVAQRYSDLCDTYGTEDILCLTRLCSGPELTEAIASTLDDGGYPTVTSLTDFAVDSLRAVTPHIEPLSGHERIELLAEFLSQHEWETRYLTNAAQQESFRQDVGALLIEMESRDALSPERYESPVLQEIATVGDEFRSLLETEEYVDEPSRIPRATDALKTAENRDAVLSAISRWDVVLVADFEELAPTERRFLSAVADAADASVVAIAERQSRLLSSWREPGSLEAMADGLDIRAQTGDSDSQSAPHAVGRYLATGDQPESEITDDSVQVIEAATFRNQLTEVADEIERLCRTNNWAYSDITVAYQDSKAPIEETVRLLRRHGIPTTTVAVTQLGNDPAVKELYDLTKVCADPLDEDEQAVSRERLLSLESVNDDLLTDLQSESTVTDGLWRWLATTQLKERIASEWDEIGARDQFQRTKQVIELAAFLEEEPRLDGTWDGLLTAMERAFRYSSTRLENIETESEEGGVPVGTIYGLKHSSYKAVFLLNVTDQAYPFTPDLTALLPTMRLQQEPQFPMLTTQSTDDVTTTFAPASETYDDPFHAYFMQVSRRLLATGACTASERLYFGVPREGTDSLGTYNQPSRFLTELIETFDYINPIEVDDETSITSHGGASEFVVEHIDDTLESVRRASVGGESVDLDAYERELAAIEALLDRPDAATVQDALEARIDFRQGRVRRE